MLALSPPMFSTFGWPFEDPISHDQQNYMYLGSETSNPYLRFSPCHPQLELEHPTIPSRTLSAGDPRMAKKLTHNASERSRRKKINGLYSSLRSLLPAADQKKKLSIPATVSQVLKYIPELQKQVERLILKKEELLSRVSRHGGISSSPQISSGRAQRSLLSAVSASRLGDKEVLIQISASKDVQQISLSEVLQNLEEDGLILIDAASFESSGGRIFYSLHLQEEGDQRMEFEILREKLSLLYQRRGELFA